MLALWARYHACGVGPRRKVSQSPTLLVLASPGAPLNSRSASTVSRSSDSFTARHQGLPGWVPSSGDSTPHRICHRMKAISARRYARMLRPPARWS